LQEAPLAVFRREVALAVASQNGGPDQVRTYPPL
jgi:hypothetical protein